MSRLITECEIRNAAQNGITFLNIEPGTIVTPLARDTAQSLGLRLGYEAGKKEANIKADAAFTGKAAPATSKMIGLLDDYLKRIWPAEPPDLKNLRKFKLPPMGNMPCVLYASFNLFWLGESMQVWRAAAQKRAIPLKELSYVVSQDMGRHAGRLAKWQMEETVEIIRLLEKYFASQGPQSHEDCVTVLTRALVALDRMQNWIDAVIPWSKMDEALKGLRTLGTYEQTGDGFHPQAINEERMQMLIDKVVKQIIREMR